MEHHMYGLVRDPPASTLHLPRILCLHGGGTNALIFYKQTRALRKQLLPHFRLCFVDAPFYCQSPGPDVTAVYKDCGPFRRWFRFEASQPRVSRTETIHAIQTAINLAMAADDAKGATGEWVGLLGFSQGAKLAASLLFRQQQQQQQKRLLGGSGSIRTTSGRRRVNFKFAVLLAGRGPLVSLDPSGDVDPGLQDAAQLMEVSLSHWDSGVRYNEQSTLKVPTIHVHGRQDPGLDVHRDFSKHCFRAGTTRLVEWDGTHRVPIKKEEVWSIVSQIIDIARQSRVLAY